MSDISKKCEMHIKTLITCVKNVFEILVCNEVVSFDIFFLKHHLNISRLPWLCASKVLIWCIFIIISLNFVIFLSGYLDDWLFKMNSLQIVISVCLCLFMRADASLSLDWSISLSIMYFNYEVSSFIIWKSYLNVGA